MAATMSSQFRNTASSRVSGVPRQALRPHLLTASALTFVSPGKRSRLLQPAPRATPRPASVGGILVDPRGFVGDYPPVMAKAAAQTLSSLNPSPSLGTVQHVPLHQLRRGNARLRPLLVALGLLTLLTVVVIGNEVATADPGPTPKSSSRFASVVVAPGDSIWIIARRMQPTGDVRPLVQAIVDAHGSAAIEAGDTLLVPLR